MDLPSLEATFEQNKAPLLAAAGAGVVGLALYKKHQKNNATAAADGTATTPAGMVLPYSAGGQTSGMTGAGGVYDSSASDLYGAVQPQLESLGAQNTDLKNAVSSLTEQINQLKNQPAPAPTPVPAPPPPPAPAPAPAYVPPAPSYAVDQWYTVRPGDSLSKIAARYPQQGITWQSIYNANKGTIGGNPNLIRPGQSLHIFGN